MKCECARVPDTKASRSPHGAWNEINEEHMTRAIIYARFSTDKQREESIEAQERACREYAAAHEYTITELYADRAASGKSDNRKDFQRMMRDAKARKFDVVLVHKYNRFARRMSDHLRYEDKLNSYGIQLIAVAEDFGTSKEAVIMKALMRSLSEYYIIDLSDEVKKGHRENAMKAMHNGGVPPFGYDVVNQKYVINEFEAAYVRRMFNCASDGIGFTALVDEMEAAGIRGKRGKPIKYSQIYDILRNEKYTGVYLYCPEQESSKMLQRSKPSAIRIEDAIPPIISKEQFMEVQKIMDSRKLPGRKSNYLCSRLVFCGECGAPMHGITTGKYQYYYCKNHCGNPNAKMETIDNAARNYLHELLMPENQQIIADALRRYQASEKYREQDFYDSLREQIAEREDKYNALLANLSSGALPPEVVADIGARMQQLKAEIEALRDSKPEKDYTAENITAWLESLRQSPDEKAIRLLIEKITVKNRTDVSIQSTLTSILGNLGCGTRIRT